MDSSTLLFVCVLLLFFLEIYKFLRENYLTHETEYEDEEEPQIEEVRQAPKPVKSISVVVQDNDGGEVARYSGNLVVSIDAYGDFIITDENGHKHIIQANAGFVFIDEE